MLGVFLKDLELKDQISLKEIGRTHRLGPRKREGARPIIVRFSTYRERKKVFDSKKKLKGSKTFISEKFAEEIGFTFISIKPSDLGSIYVHGAQEKIGEYLSAINSKNILVQ